MVASNALSLAKSYSIFYHPCVQGNLTWDVHGLAAGRWRKSSRFLFLFLQASFQCNFHIYGLAHQEPYIH